MPERAGSPPAGDPLAQFLAAVRRPLEFLAARRRATAAARTQLPGARARRARPRAAHAPVDGAAARRARRAVRAARASSRRAPPARARCAGRRVPRAARRSSRRAAAAARDIAARRTGAARGDLAAALVRLAQSVQFAKDVGPRRAELLRKFGIETVEDLLYHLPFRYEDRRRVRDDRQRAARRGGEHRRRDRAARRAHRRRAAGAASSRACCATRPGCSALTWYHQVTYFRARFQRRPALLVLRQGRALARRRQAHRAPRGRARARRASRRGDPAGLREADHDDASARCARSCSSAVRDYADARAERPARRGHAAARALTDPGAALRALHLPDARRRRRPRSTRFALAGASLAGLRRALLPAARPGPAPAPDRSGVRPGAAARAARSTERLARGAAVRAHRARSSASSREIDADMARPHPMHRLVQGDVGSGKTIVALFAALVAIENGYQVAFMAPTELLAEQHFATIARVRRGARRARRAAHRRARAQRAASALRGAGRAARSSSSSARTP